MRLIANIKNVSDFKRAMLYQCKDGCYIFLYDKDEDCSCKHDYLQDDLEIAKEFCKEEYGINYDDWVKISDPQVDCQDDWIAPVRVKGREKGKPQWGEFEKLDNGKWIKVKG